MSSKLKFLHKSKTLSAIREPSMYHNVVKPVVDFILCLTAIIALSPILILVTVLLLIANNGKPFFFQVRPGKNEKLFKLIKFKTMSEKKDKNGNLLPDVERITFVGNLVRKTSLDEVPQFINVLKGEMSLIGPRPLLVQYLPLYNDFQKRRHEVRPGITGWAQVNGRNAISWEEKFEYDVYYVDNCSFMLDLRIFFMTVLKVLKSEGVNKDAQISMEVFKGTEQ